MSLSVSGSRTGASTATIYARCNAGNWYAVFVAPVGTSTSSQSWLCVRSTTNSTGSLETFTISSLTSTGAYVVYIAERSTSFATVGTYYSMTWTMSNLDYSRGQIDAYSSVSYAGTLSLSGSYSYDYNTSYPYMGYAGVTVSITSGAGNGWTIKVYNDNTGNYVTKFSNVGSGNTYSVDLQYLYDGSTGEKYYIYLFDPDGVQQSRVTVPHRAQVTKTYTLHYFPDASDVSGMPSEQSVTVMACYTYQIFTVSSVEPTREGYTFLGWATSSGATSAAYVGGSSITVTGTTYLYAVWEKQPNTFYLLFDANGGSGAPARRTAQSKNEYYTFYLSAYTLTEPTRSGYSFVGWGTSASSTVAATSFTAYSTTDYAVTAYAIWEKAVTALVPNITSLVISGVSASGFSVTATQDNLQAGYWRIEISADSSFSSIISSTQVIYSTRTLSYDFTGLSANTLYYIRVRNYYDGDAEYAGTWSRRTGITAFAWTNDDAANVVAGVVPQDVITAAKWNTLAQKISAVNVRRGGGSLSFTTVYSERDVITAALFNELRDALANLSGAGSVTAEVSAGSGMTAAQFANDTASLKSAINRAIAALNS